MSKAQSKSALPETLSLDQLRMLLGVNTSHINNLERQGIIEKTERNTYTLASVPAYIGWLRKVQAGPQDWRDVRTEIGRERLALLRLERGQREGELLDKTGVRNLNISIAATIKNKLLAVPRATAPQLLGLSHASQAEAVTMGAITVALEELAALADVAEPQRRRHNGA
jgi:phage terminase Nu1 subunit (DNA packaging protein)